VASEEALAAPDPVGPAERLVVAVMEVQDNSSRISVGDLLAATEMLRGRLAASGRFVVIDKSRQQASLQKMVEERKKESYRECYDRSCQIPLGQALAADTILRSSISCLGDACQFSAELVDLAREASTGGGAADFDATAKGLAEAIKQVAQQIIGACRKARSAK